MFNGKKLCFVIMGFGRKSDLSTGKTYDLDKTYKNIIKPATEILGYQCVRADEIQDSGLIDKSMYALLMYADLVIADISTYNPNAIYELGIRHAVRPFSTIILKENEGKIPFDLDHNRILHYTHLGDDIGFEEVTRCRDELSSIINNVTKNHIIDSPLYDFIKDITPPSITPSEYKKIIGDLAEREDRIFAISERAKHCMDEGEFWEASKLWKRATELVPNESYFIQQRALATYKSKTPTEQSALMDALSIINDLNPDGDTNDPETLGLTGAIYKRFWLITKDPEYLNRAIKYYGKGFQIRKDYYNAENYALCLNFASSISQDTDERIYFNVSAKKVRKEIIEILSEYQAQDHEFDTENKWIYATIANSFFGLGDNSNAHKFEEYFLRSVEVDWERDTYFDSKKQLLNLVEGLNNG